jgi:uncharacterized membrane protein YdbT with pleckstrin-like domain
MAYPTHLLNDNETIALDLRPHWWYFSKHIFSSIPLIVLFVLWAITHDGDHWYHTPIQIIFVAAAIAWLAWFLYKFLQWRFTYFVVSSQRVIYRTGVISRKGTEIPLERINNINFNQNIWERIIGAGDLEVESAGKDGQTTFENVNHPDGVQQEIYRQMEVNARKQAGWIGEHAATAVSNAASAVPPAGDLTAADQIAKLNELHQAGALTDAEFESKKAELLGRM